MSALNYVACFFAGMFMANAVPHFVHGISGDPFPTPFAHPPGRGLSPPLVNTIWALFNGLAGYLLFRYGNVARSGTGELIGFFAGAAAISVTLSIHFQKKHAA